MVRAAETARHGLGNSLAELSIWESGVCAKAKVPNGGAMYLPEAERWQRNCRVSWSPWLCG